MLTTAGAFLLFVGWIGFNGGSTLAATPAIAPIIANTVLAAGMGGLFGYLSALIMDRIVLPEKPLSGMLGGLVAVTASCHLLDGAGAMLMGALGGLAAIWGHWLLENRFKVDDAVGAIGVHGFAGVTGTLMLAFLAPTDSLPTGNMLTQLGVQALGAVINFAWSFGLGYAGFLVMRHFYAIRPTVADEERGLNEAEHGTRLGIGHVETALAQLAAGQAGLDLRLAVTRGDDAETLTNVFNDFMNRIEAAEQARGTERENSRAREEAERLTAMADAAFEGICVTVKGRIRDGNKAFERLLQYELAELQAMTFAELVSHGDRDSLEEAIARADGQPVELSMLARDGTAVPVEVRTREVSFQGRMTRVFALADLSERKVAEERIRFLAQHDPLTGLPNRAVFNHQLQAAIEHAGAGNVSAALLLVDLDRFKEVNDVHGHPAGDVVLQQTASRLLELVGKDGTVARLGGDEFAVVLNAIHFAAEAAELAHHIVETMAKPVRVSDSLIVRVGASVGIAIMPKDGAEGRAALNSADVALYAAKDRGRNTYSLFEPGMDAELKMRRLLEADLEHAVERGELELHFQPRINVRLGEIVGYEALLRWNHRQRGQISPADFIPVAERSGQIIAIGEWVLREACRVALKTLGEATVSVNVSAVQFRDKMFVDKVLGVLEDLDFPPGRLELEITESVLVEDEKRAAALFKRLKQVGIRLALDDFGTGYSSLSYLRSFPFDCIKMDRSFVQGLGVDNNARAIAEAMIHLGKSLDLTIVAEGVEKLEELEMLARGGCDEVQGFLTGRPMPVRQLPARLPAGLPLPWRGASDAIGRLAISRDEVAASEPMPQLKAAKG